MPLDYCMVHCIRYCGEDDVAMCYCIVIVMCTSTLKPGHSRVIRVTFFPGHPGLTRFTNYPGLTRIGSREKRNCLFNDVETYKRYRAALS